MTLSSIKHELPLIYQKLGYHFGKQGWWPLYNKKTGRIDYHPGDFSLPRTEEQSFEISVGAILTQNTTWKNAEKALLSLHHHSLLTPEKINNINTDQLAAIIKSSGYHQQKAKKLKAFVTFLASKQKITREHLLRVWGIGPETADSNLLYAYRKPIFVIDAYTKRIMERVGYSEKTYDSLQALFMTALSRDAKLFNEYHALLVALGKAFCKKTNPLCEQCPIKNCCAYFLRKRSSADDER